MTGTLIKPVARIQKSYSIIEDADLASQETLSMDNYVIAENKYGKYCIPKSSAYTFTSKAILAGNVHEESTIRYICENCGEGDIVHAGSGFGDFLPALSKACIGTVWTFEPNLENFECSKETIKMNHLQNVKLFNSALGSVSKSAMLKVEEKGISLGVRSEIAEDGTQNTQIEVLDNKIGVSRPISIIHLDVEGYEFNILDGARKVIEKFSPLVILEIDGRALDYNNYMKSLGYKPKEQLIYDVKEMVFVNTVYQKN